MKENRIYMVSKLLIIFLILSLFIALFSIALPRVNYATTNEGLYYGLLKIWRFFLFLPISIASIAFGIYYKKKNYKVAKNIVVGVIFSSLFIGFGLMHFIGLNNYSRDIGYMKEIENKVDFNFPSRADILTFDWTKGVQSSSDNYYYKYESVVRFTDEDEISEFIYQLSNSTKWENNLSNTTIYFIPQNFYLETKNYSYKRNS